LQRHLKPPSQKRPHWHIDFLLTAATIQKAAWSLGAADLECRWASLMAAQGQHYPPAFGASDCRCPGHLLHFTSARRVEAALQSLGELTKLIVAENPLS
jgi:Uri superfamily endonuclease